MVQRCTRVPSEVVFLHIMEMLFIFKCAQTLCDEGAPTLPRVRVRRAADRGAQADPGPLLGRHRALQVS